MKTLTFATIVAIATFGFVTTAFAESGPFPSYCTFGSLTNGQVPFKCHATYGSAWASGLLRPDDPSPTFLNKEAVSCQLFLKDGGGIRLAGCQGGVQQASEVVRPKKK